MIEWLEKNRIFPVIFFILIAAEIFFFSFFSGGAPSPAPELFDISRIYHFSVFFLLNFFLLVSLNGGGKMKISYLIIAVLFSIFCAMLDEVHQSFVPFREASLWDMLTDSIGILSSSLAYLYSKNS